MPGSMAAQLAIYLGYVRGRVLGATLVGWAFVLPSFAMVMIVGAVYVAYGGIGWMQGVRCVRFDSCRPLCMVQRTQAGQERSYAARQRSPTDLSGSASNLSRLAPSLALTDVTGFLQWRHCTVKSRR